MHSQDQHRRFLECAKAFDNLLWKVARSFATGADQDDLHQELLIALWKALPAFRGESKESTYVYRVAYNYALTWKRKARSQEVGLDEASQVAASPPGPSTEADLEWLYERIRELRPVDRTLVLLYLDEVPYRDIAEIMGLSESNVGVRLNRVKKLLAERLQEVSRARTL